MGLMTQRKNKNTKLLAEMLNSTVLPNIVNAQPSIDLTQIKSLGMTTTTKDKELKESYIEIYKNLYNAYQIAEGQGLKQTMTKLDEILISLEKKILK